MSVTLTSNYQEVLSAEVLELIETLQDDGHDLRDMLEFIDEYSEEDFVNYYDDYDNAMNDLPTKAVEAFIDEFGIDYIEHAVKAYQGQYDSESHFAEAFTIDNYGEVPDFVVVDWDATFESHLYYDFAFCDGFVFSKNT